MHWKMSILFTYENLRAFRFKSSYAFLTHHLHLPHAFPAIYGLNLWMADVKFIPDLEIFIL